MPNKIYCIKNIVVFLLEPSGSPKGITTEPTSPKSITVSWGPVPASDRNGEILGYKIIYQALPSGDSITKEINATGDNEQETTLDNLNEFTNYSIRMLAFTSVGDGPLSAAVLVQTQDDSECFISLSISSVSLML